MTTIELYENGNTYQLTYKKSEERQDGKKYINIDGELCEVISKIRTNKKTVDWEIRLD